MYEELITALRTCVDEEKGCDECPYYGKCMTTVGKHAAMVYAADAIEELSMKLHGDEAAIAGMKREIERMVVADKPCWIPVTEPPKKDGWYQVYAPGYSGGSSSGLKNINGNMYSAFKHGKWSIEVGYHKRPGCVKA